MKKVFKSPYESLRYCAEQNDGYCCSDAALRQFKQALELAPNEVEKEYCKKRIEQLKKEVGK